MSRELLWQKHADKLVNSLWRKYDRYFQGDRDDEDLIEVRQSSTKSRDTSEKPSQCVKRPQYSTFRPMKGTSYTVMTLQRWKRLPKVKFPGIVRYEDVSVFVYDRNHSILHHGATIRSRSRGWSGWRGLNIELRD